MHSYNGGTTGTDAVWAGVPILTLPLNKFAARFEGGEGGRVAIYSLGNLVLIATADTAPVTA